MFSSTLLVQALLATIALAAPSNNMKLVQRGNSDQNILSACTHDSLTAASGGIAVADPPHLYNLWYGGAYVTTSGQAQVRFVTAEFSVPEVKPPSGPPAFFGVDILLGLDVFTTCPYYLVVGTRPGLASGTFFYSNLYEWIRRSDGQVVARGSFNDVKVKADDELQYTIQMTNATTGVFTLNKNSGEQLQQVHVSVPASESLCLESPSWFVRVVSDTRPLVNFVDVSFDGARAAYANGQSFGPQAPGSAIVDIRRNGTIYTETSLGSQSVSIRYTQ